MTASNFWRGLTLFVVMATAAGCGTTKPLTDGGAVNVSLTSSSACGTTITLVAGQGSASVTLSGTVTGASVGSPVTLMDNGSTVALSPAVVLDSQQSFSFATSLSASVADHQLVVSVTDSGGKGSGSSATCDIHVVSGTTGGCTLTLSPVNGALFNESDGGALLTGRTTLSDEDFTTPGIQAQITVATQNCAGPVTLTVNGTQVGSTMPANGQAVFDQVNLPDTSVHAFVAADGGDQIVAASGSSSTSAQYFADSVLPSADITSPVSGANFTTGNDAGALVLPVAGTTQSFDLGDGMVSYRIIDADSGVQLSAAASLDSSGNFATTTTTIPNGIHYLAFSGESWTGNPATSNLVMITSSLPVTISFGTGAPPASPAVLNGGFDYDPLTAGFQFLVPVTTNASSGAVVTLCSTVQPPTAVSGGNCPAGQFAVGVATVGSNPNVSVLVTLGQGAQNLTANVAQGSGTASTATLAIIVHSLTPILEQLTFSGTYQDDAGRIWLNAADLVDAGLAVAQLAITVDATDQYSGASGAVGSVTVTNGNAVLVAGIDGGSAGSPTGALPLALPAGVEAYKLTARATDIWGNQSDPKQTSPVAATFSVFVKTTLPSCTLASPGACFTVADNLGAMTAGSASVGVPASVTNGAGPDDPNTSLPIPGFVEVGVNGAVDGGAIGVTSAAFSLPVPVPAGQGSDSFAGIAVDPAGNPPAMCSGGFSLTVATTDPTLAVSVNADPTTPGTDAAGNQIYTTTRTVTAALTNTGATGNLTAYIAATATGSPTSLPVIVPSTASSVTIPNAPNSPAGAPEFLVVQGADSCGNPGFSTAQLDVNVPGCDLTLVSPQPTTLNGTSEVVFNAASGAVSNDQLTTSLMFHSSCTGTGVTLTFNGGMSSGTTDASTGNVSFMLMGLADNTTGTLTATVAGANGVTLGPVPYLVKLTTPSIGTSSPAISGVQIVANQDNPLDGGSATLLVVPNAIASTSSAAATFTVSGLQNLGPVDGNNNVGQAKLTATFPGASVITSTQAIASGSTSVTFTPTNLPGLSYPQSGTVALQVTDNTGNAVTQSWTVTTGVNSPPAPSVSASMADERKANVQLSWTVPSQSGSSPIVGYELRYQISNPALTPLGTPSEAAYAALTPVVDAALSGNAAAPGSAETYTVIGLPTLNQYDFELRAVDGLGNRSALAAAANATSCTINAANPGVCTGGANQWTTLQLQGPPAANSADFGFRMTTGKLHGPNGHPDLVIGAPGRFSGVNGNVYVLPGAASYAGVGGTWPNPSLTNLTLGAVSGNDYFGFDLATGDFNSDGTEDLAIGAPLANNGQGEVLLYFGSATGLPATPNVTITGVTLAGNFGWSVQSLDINGDGIADLLIGAPQDGSNANGIVYGYLGNATWASTTPAMTITGNPGDRVGGRWGLASLGHAEGATSTFNDFAIGGPGGTINAGDAGVGGNVYFVNAAYALDAGSFGVSTNSLFPALSIGGEFCDANDDYNSGFYGCFGANVVTGTFTGGALPDLLVSSLYSNTFWLFEDSLSASPPGPQSPAVFSGDPASTFDFGWSLSPGDINGDGKLDLIGGANDGTISTVFIYLNGGTGLTGPNASVVATVGTYFGYGSAAADIRGIGAADFALSDPFTSYVNIYY